MVHKALVLALSILVLSIGALHFAEAENVGLDVDLCGDGIDQDSSGSDLPCGGNDKDFDGFPEDQDCNDDNRYIYDGISAPCDCGPSSTGWMTCQNGVFTACECNAALCEAADGSSCYYIDAINGDDANPGTWAQPWKTYLKIVSYYTENLDAIKLANGDYVYFLDGTYTSTYQYDSETKGMFFRGLDPTVPITLKNYPGHVPVLQPEGVVALGILQCSNIVVQGFEVTAPASFTGISIAEVTNVTLHNNWVHDIDGVDNNNLAGIHLLTSLNGHVHHNRINDNYDRTNADTGGYKTENSRNMVLFNGGYNRIMYNIIYQTKSMTDPVTGGCVTYKHRGDDDKSFEVAYNYFWNCAFHAIGSGTANSHVHHNLILNSQVAVVIKDFGGTTSNFGNLIEYNTVVSSAALYASPTNEYGTDIGSLEFRNNVIVANLEQYDVLHPTGEDKAIVNVWRYGSNEQYALTVPFLAFDHNCYSYSAINNENTFDLFSLSESMGALYDFAGWRDLGFDLNSFREEPLLNDYFVATADNCMDKGFGYGLSAAPSASSAPSGSPSSSPVTSPSARTPATSSGAPVRALSLVGLLVLISLLC